MKTTRLALSLLLSISCAARAEKAPAPITADIRIEGHPRLQPMPTPRGSFAGGIVDGRIYVLGGWEQGEDPEDLTPYTVVESYDLAADRWTTRKPMPSGRTSAISAVIGGKIYVFGGCLIAGCPSGRGATNRVDIYDPKTDSWSAGSPMPRTRYLGQAALLNGRVFIPGGYVDGQPSSAVDVFDPAKNAWSSAPPLPPRHIGGGSAALGGKLYVLNGDSSGQAAATLDIYDPDSKAWTAGPPLPDRARYYLSAAALDGKLHVVGGVTFLDSGSGAVEFSRRDDVFDPATGVWTSGPAMTASHNLFTAFSDGQRIAVLGGRWGAGHFAAIDVLPAGASAWHGSGPAAAPATAQAPPASDVDGFTGHAEPRRGDFALIVGIDRYRSVPAAAFGAHDAQVFRRYAETVLGVPPENIILLEGDKASRADLAKYLEEWLPKNVTKDSRIYFYYSGHGAPDPSAGTAYLVPWDGDPEFLDSTAYPLPRLYDKLAALKAKETLVLLDTCFSGLGSRSLIAKNLRPLVSVVEPAKPVLKRFSVLTAASGSEVAGGLDSQRHGLFTYYLLKGLMDAADAKHDGHLELGGLYDYVRKEVLRAAHRQNREQHPRLQTSEPDLKLF